MTSTRRAFTLMELLVVVGIVVLLAGMLTPLLTLAGRSAKRNNSQAIMGKADLALRLYKQEMGFYPYQRTYPALGDTTGWSNRLMHFLNSTMSSTQMTAVRADMDTAALRYNYVLSGGGTVEPPINAANVHMLRENRGAGAMITFAAYNGLWSPYTLLGPIPESDLRPMRWWWTGTGYVATYPRQNNDHTGTGVLALTLLNSLAAERARMLIASGYYDAPGLNIPTAKSPDGLRVHPGRDCSGSLLVLAPQADGTGSNPKPGLGADYLERAIEPRFIDPNGETLLDAWGNPIVYLCQVLPGVRGTAASYGGGHSGDLKTRDYGMDVTGRTSLAKVDPWTGIALQANLPFLPDPQVTRHSASTRYAAPGNELDFELWSAGPNGLFDDMRDGLVNRDNIGYRAYDKGLLP